MPRSGVGAACVFLAALAVFSYRVGDAGIGYGYVDPVGKIAAQDEAVYSHTALRMASRGEWLTPRFLERLALYKPPALYWFSGLAVAAIGPARFALRFPSLVAGGLVAALVFWWTRRIAGVSAGLCAAALFVADPLAHILARMNLTDMLLTFWITAALAALAADPALERARSAPLLGACAGMAILTKAVAGALPLVVLGLWRLAAPRGRRPAWAGMARAAATAFLIILPWHAYQFVVHRRWFVAEYIQDEILFWGAGAPPQTSAENQAWFYLRRMGQIDPLLCVLALLGAVWSFRRPAAGRPRLPAVWIAVMAAAVLVFSYRNAAYLLPAVPALAIVAAACTPVFRARAGVVAFVVLAALIPLKAHFPDRAWGLPFYHGVVPSGRALASYCESKRTAELIVVSPEDEFLSAVLPLERVRYVFLMPDGYRDQRALDLRYLGILVTADEFLRLPGLVSMFTGRLRQWGQNNAPLATAIVARSDDEIRRLIEASPGSDFLVPRRFASAAHDILPATTGRLFLLARGVGRATQPRPACGL